MEHTAKPLKSNVNTLERSYTNHLRDKLGYTGALDIARVNQQGLSEALSALDSTQRNLETYRISNRLVAELEPQKKERGEVYTSSLARSRNAAAQIADRLGKLPNELLDLNTSAVEDLGSLCDELTRNANNVGWAITTWNVIADQVSKYSAAANSGEPPLYAATRWLLYSMGLSEPEKAGVLEDLSRTVNPKRLETVKHSARYLLNRLGGSVTSEISIRHIVDRGCVV
ncbi:MAG: hypothetical protein AABX47_06115 [Nanoarchaeota archaeon]